MALDFASLRATFDVLLTHRCTVTPIRAGAEDQHYDATPTAGDPIPDVPCTYSTIQRATRDVDGVTLVSVPALMASATGPIRVGAQITAITDQLGVILAAGPMRVDRVLDDTAGLGAALLPTYELRAVEAGLP